MFLVCRYQVPVTFTTVTTPVDNTRLYYGTHKNEHLPITAQLSCCGER